MSSTGYPKRRNAASVTKLAAPPALRWLALLSFLALLGACGQPPSSPPDPTIVAFTASDDEVDADSDVQLTWEIESTGDATCEIVRTPTEGDPAQSPVDCTGSESFTVATDTTFTLQVLDATGNVLVSAEQDVSVREDGDQGDGGSDSESAWQENEADVGSQGGTLGVQTGVAVNVNEGFFSEDTNVVLRATDADGELEDAIAPFAELTFDTSALNVFPEPIEFLLVPFERDQTQDVEYIDVFARHEDEQVELGTFQYRTGVMEVLTLSGEWLQGALDDAGIHGIVTLRVEPKGASRGEPRSAGHRSRSLSLNYEVVEGLFAVDPSEFGSSWNQRLLCGSHIEPGGNVAGFEKVTTTRESTKRAVVLLHGWQEGGSARKARIIGSRFHPALCNRGELLKELFEGDGEGELLHAYDFYSFGYDSRRRVAEVSGDLRQAAKRLDYEEILFVGHSMGGLIIHDFVQDLPEGHELRSSPVLVKGSPLRGAGIVVCREIDGDQCVDSLIVSESGIQVPVIWLWLGAHDMAWEHPGVEYREKITRRKSEFPFVERVPVSRSSKPNPLLQDLNDQLTSNDLENYYAFLGTRQRAITGEVDARGMETDGLIPLQSTCLSTAKGVRALDDHRDNDCSEAMIPEANITRFDELAHAGVGNADNADGVRDWLLAQASETNVEEVSLVGVVADQFTTDGGTFTLTVSPRDEDGDFVDASLSLSDFSIHGVEVLQDDATVTSGSAVPVDQEVKAPGSGSAASVVLSMDSSGSMGWNDAERLRVDAGKTLVNRLQDDDEAAVLDFGAGTDSGLQASRLLQPFTSDKTQLEEAIEQVVASGGTPLYAALLDAVDVAAGASNADRAIVVMTDGIAGDGGLATDAIDAAVDAGLPVFPIGLGDEVAFQDLQDLAAATGGAYAEAKQASALDPIFDAVGVGVSGGRILVEAEGTFDPPLTDPGQYDVVGTLRTQLPDGAIDTPFRFRVIVKAVE